MQNPFLAIMNRQAEIMLRAASELGFTPACRPRIQTSEATEPDARRGDELERLLDQRPSIN
jgi:phage terminase small subunit